MYCTVLSGALRGVESYLAHVEVDVSRGLPGFEMVGLLGSEVKEARERIRVALKNADLEIPPCRITVNISPADEHKGGTAFDLPVAVGILVARGIVVPEKVKGIMIAGELGLNGEVAPIKGILPLIREAEKKRIRGCLFPAANLAEAVMASELPVMGVDSLQEAAAYLCATESTQERMREEKLAEMRNGCNEGRKRELSGRSSDSYGWGVNSYGWSGHSYGAGCPDFKDVKGQAGAKRAALIAAAGFHHLFLLGPPGSGKTMLAGCLSGILPPLSMEEKLEVSAVYSVAGLLGEKGLIEERPFIAPHHTISPAGLIGGGIKPVPGMVSLAHKGILFMDEMTECRRSTLDLLRQPMEEKCIRIARNHTQIVFPAEFMLVGAANPCPCGYFPDRSRCRCRENEIRRYMGRLSGPLMDRFDLCAELTPVKSFELFAGDCGWGAEEKMRTEGSAVAEERAWTAENSVTEAGESDESSQKMQEKVTEARMRQKWRFRESGMQYNGGMGVKQLYEYCPLGQSEQQFLEQLMDTCALSARACHRIWRTARTIADLDGFDVIGKKHLGEAACYRLTDCL